MRILRLLACVTAAALAVMGCDPHDARVHVADQSGPAGMSTPALRPPPQPSCARLAADAACRDWTPLSPQPGFAEMLHLQAQSRAPTEASWSGLYLCGALPDELLTRHLGAGYFKVIYQDYICGLTSPDQTRTVQLSLADGPLDSWLPHYDPAENPKTRTTLHGRDAITRVPDDSTYDGLVVDRDAVVSIPATAALVIVVSVRFSTDLAGTDIHRPDRAAADRVLDEVVAAVVDLSG